jgi:hypothetical protein
VEPAQRRLAERVDATDEDGVDDARVEQPLRAAEGLRAGRARRRHDEGRPGDERRAPQQLEQRAVRVLTMQIVVGGQRARARERGVRPLGAREARRRRAHDERDAIGAVAREGARERGAQLVEPRDGEPRRRAVALRE